MNAEERIAYFREKRESAATLPEEADALQQLIRLAREENDAALLAEMLTEYGGVIKYLGRCEEAESAFAEVRSLLEAAGAAETSEYANCLVNLANLYRMMGRPEEAERLFREAIPLGMRVCDEESRASMLNNLALLYQEQGRFDDALALHRRNLENAAASGRPAWQTGSTYNNIAAIYIKTKRFDEAAEAARQALAYYDDPEAGDALRVTALNTLAAAYYGSGRLAEALSIFRQIEPLALAAYGEDSPAYRGIRRSIRRLEEARQ